MPSSNASSPLTRWFVCAALAFGCSLAVQAAPTRLGDLNGDGISDVRDLQIVRGHINGSQPLAAEDAVFADLNKDGAVNESDIEELTKEILGTRTPEQLPLVTVQLASPSSGEVDVAVTRETILHFSIPLHPSTAIDTTRFYAEFGGRKILSRVEIASDRKKATLFYLEPLPSNARLRVTLDGTGLTDLLGRGIDLDSDTVAGGVFQMTFDTLSITGFNATAVVGRVLASETNGAGQNVPIAGVTVTVDGAEQDLRAVTDANGNFTLSPCPAGTFFVHIDGRTSPASSWPSGSYYPFVGKKWHAIAGKLDNKAGDVDDSPTGATGIIYLPLVAAGSLQSVSSVGDTTIEFPPSVIAANPALAGTRITVPANSLFADDGTRGGKIGIAPVPSDRLPGPLPQGLEPPFVITIQSDGANNFDRPVPLCLPNTEHLPPGTKRYLVSFNHDLGEWEPVGPMTVTEDGQFVKTDTGVGVIQPGWHAPGPPPHGPPPPPKPPCGQSCSCPPENDKEECFKDYAKCMAKCSTKFWKRGRWCGPLFGGGLPGGLAGGACLLIQGTRYFLCIKECDEKLEACLSKHCPATHRAIGLTSAEDVTFNEILSRYTQIEDLIYPYALAENSAPRHIQDQINILVEEANIIAGGDIISFLNEKMKQTIVNAQGILDIAGNAPAYPVRYAAMVKVNDKIVWYRGFTKSYCDVSIFLGQ